MPVSPSSVWKVLADVGGWPRWTRVVRFASLGGPLAPGSALYWNADGMRISSVLLEVDQPRCLGWTLRTMGARGYIRWTLLELPSGGTRVCLEESWEGLAVRLLRGTLRRTLETSRAEILDGLDRACSSEAAP
jgi:hypothetical protein